MSFIREFMQNNIQVKNIHESNKFIKNYDVEKQKRNCWLLYNFHLSLKPNFKTWFETKNQLKTEVKLKQSDA